MFDGKFGAGLCIITVYDFEYIILFDKGHYYRFSY